MTLIKIFLSLILIITLSLFLFGILSYEGNKIYYSAFTLVSIFSIFYCFRYNSISFESFLALLLWLGFWFKFTVQISFLNNMFPEGVGTFDYTSSSYNEVVLVSIVANLAIITSSFIREKFIFNYSNKKNANSEKQLLNVTKSYIKNKRKFIFLYLFLLIFIPGLNYFFVFFQKGTIPETYLPFGLNNIFNWLLMFGLASLSCVLIYLDFLSNKIQNNKYIKFGVIETSISSISILSRAMIFNGTSIIFGFYRMLEINNLKIKAYFIIKYFISLFFLFFLTLILVSEIRQSKDFKIGHEVHEYISTIKISQDSKQKKILEETNELIRTVNQILFLISGRWVGVEGVMAVVNNNNLGFDAFFSSFSEKFNYSNSFYENNVKKNLHIYKEDSNTYTIYVPGIIAFLFYTQSLIFLFISMVILCLFCSFIEKLSFKYSYNNILFSYLIGNVLAYRLAHFGYMPQNSFKIILAIVLNIFLLNIIFKLISKFEKKK